MSTRVRLLAALCVTALSITAFAFAPRRAMTNCANAVIRMNPCGGTILVAPGLTNQKQIFTIYNETERDISMPVGAICNDYVTSCSESPFDPTINAMSSTNVTVTYSTSKTAGSGLLGLVGHQDTGYVGIATSGIRTDASPRGKTEVASLFTR